MTNMHEQLIDVLARERREKMLREAEIYRLMTDGANLKFGPGPITRSRGFSSGWHRAWNPARTARGLNGELHVEAELVRQRPKDV